MVVDPSADRLYMTELWLTMVGRSMKTPTTGTASYAPEKQKLLLRLGARTHQLHDAFQQDTHRLAELALLIFVEQ